MSPRPPRELPTDVIDTLHAAQARAESAQAELRAAVRAALDVGSVRQVAAALGISPTTVQAWKRGTDHGTPYGCSRVEDESGQMPNPPETLG